MSYASGLISGSYCTYEDICTRRLIQRIDNSYDNDLSGSAVEARYYIDTQIKPYYTGSYQDAYGNTTVPLTIIPSEVAHICADLSAAIFRRKFIQDDMKVIGLRLRGAVIDEESMTGYWALGVKKLKDWILKNYYLYSLFVALDEKTITDLFDAHLISDVEARALLAKIQRTVISFGHTFMNYMKTGSYPG